METTVCFVLALQTQWPFIKESGFALLLFNKYFLLSVVDVFSAVAKLSVVQISSILAMSGASCG